MSELEIIQFANFIDCYSNLVKGFFRVVTPTLRQCLLKPHKLISFSAKKVSHLSVNGVLRMEGVWLGSGDDCNAPCQINKKGLIME